MGKISYKRVKGSQNLRQRLLLATLSATPILVEDIRADQTIPGLRPHEESLLHLIEKVSDDCLVEINETGTKFKYKPGIVMGGRHLVHDCGLSRSIGYFMEPLIILGLFAKKPLTIRLKGITNGPKDPCVDTFRSTTLPMLKQFGVPQEGLSLKIESRGSPPHGGGEVVLSIPIVQSLTAANWIDEGLVKRIRGITYSTKVSSQFENTMIHSARGIFNRLLPDVHIFTDHKAGPQAGNSPGYGISLVAETTSGCFISADTTISYARGDDVDEMEYDEEKKELMPPEEVGEQIASVLLQEIEQGGVVDSTHQATDAVGSDSAEVDKVCKVIDELFALDRNMEAVLDELGVNLSHDLVVTVLERFRHARKPAFRFFCWAGQRPGFAHDSRTYNLMMSVLAKTRQFETMVSLLEEMGEKKVLNMETFMIAMKGFAAAKERRKAVSMFELMKKYKYKVGVETINTLLDCLGRAKLGKEAQALFVKLDGRFTPNLKTYSVLLNGWCRVKNLMEAGKIWNEMIDKGFMPDIVAHNTMLEGLLKTKKRSDAIKLFEVMKAKGPSPDVRSYTILIRDLCKQGKMEEAVEYFDEMVHRGCQPDAAVYTCLITGFGNQKRMDIVYDLLKEMKDKGCPPDGRTYNALIKLLTSRLMPDDAVTIYKNMAQSGIEPSIHTYNMIMKSYFQIRNFDMGYAVWDEMTRKGCCPDDNSYTVFVGGLIRQGRVGEACKYLEEMIEKGMKVPQLDYNKFAADFSRAGKPDILDELAQKMKFCGKFEVSNVFARWADMMKKRVKRRDPRNGLCTQFAEGQE